MPNAWGAPLQKVMSFKQKVKSESCSVMFNSLGPHGLHSSWNSPGQNIGVGSLSLLQGDLPGPGIKPRSPNCRWILYQLSHPGFTHPRLLEWVAYLFSSRSSWLRNQTRVSCIADEGSPNLAYKWLRARGQGARVLSEGNQGTERKRSHCKLCSYPVSKLWLNLDIEFDLRF